MNVDTRTAADQTMYQSISQRIPVGRWGTPDDFKGAVVFLASKANSYITGEILMVCFCFYLPKESLKASRSMVGIWLDKLQQLLPYLCRR